MERITSRKNQIIAHLRRLGTEGAYRREQGLFLCDGEKLLKEALDFGALPETVLWDGEPKFELPVTVRQFSCPEELIAYVSPLKNSRGPVFSVRMRVHDLISPCACAMVLENVQDPGNVGTVIRTAAAMGIGAVILLGDCADLYNPKTVRSTMGGIFRQRVLETDEAGLIHFLNENGLRLYGAALSKGATDLRRVDTKRLAVAIGSEGQGLSESLLSRCEGQLIIPMEPGSESLNAAVAASVIMWELYRKNRGD